jgi:hypothetical protein
MKKMITLGLITCVSLTNNTMLGMLTNKLCKRIVQGRQYTNNDIIIGTIMTRVEYINQDSRETLAITKEINKKLNLLLTAQAQKAEKPAMQQAPQEEQQGLKELQPVGYEPKELYSIPNKTTEASPTRYQRELEAYHVRSQE